MRTVAHLVIDQARELVERLKKESIPAELGTVPQEGGLEVTEIRVDDADFDRACETAETWEAERVADIARNSPKRCPKCRSGNLEYVPDHKIEYHYRCKDCGCDVVFRR
jgi:hypothetical protein